MNTLRRIVSVMGCLLLIPGLASAQQNAQEILNRAIETMGGDAYRQITEIQSSGRFYQFQRGELAGTEIFADYLQLPDKERVEYGKDPWAIRINNGDRGWNIQDEDVEPQIPEQIEVFWEELKISLDYLLRVTIHKPTSTLQYVGRDMIDFKRVDILEIRDEDRTRFNLYIDRESGLLVKKSVRRLQDPAVHEEIYSNYHELQGILTPLLVNRYTDGVKTMEIRFEKVAYNPGFPDDLFTVDQEE